MISGTGALTVNASGDSAYGPIIVLAGNNTYSGGTTMSVGSCYVTNNGTGSGTGSGAVAVSGGTFGGDGALSGPLNLSGGTLAPGYSFNVGPLPVTAVTKAIGKLTLANGLQLVLAMKKAAVADGSFRIRGASAKVREIVFLAGFDGVFGEDA